MIHITEDNNIIDCRKLYTHFLIQKTEPKEIPISKIIHKPLSTIYTNDSRFLLADTRYPGIVVDKNDHFYMIDGRHRLLKTITNGLKYFNAYVIDERLYKRFTYF